MTNTSVITILKRYSWDEFVDHLRQVGLVGDTQLKPYAQAHFSLETVSTDDIAPISKYVLKGHVTMQQYLRQTFAEQHQIDIFNLPQQQPTVVFEISDEQGQWLISPPIVEVSSADQNRRVLLDGEHRFYYARQLGLPVTAVVVENVHPRLPVVGLPLEWDQVSEFAQTPPIDQKRHFRFPTLDSFPDVSDLTSVKITAENFHYFFYRDLSTVCSTGVRSSGSK